MLNKKGRGIGFKTREYQVAKIEIHKREGGIIVCKWFDGYTEGNPADKVNKSPRSFEEAKEWLDGSDWMVEEVTDTCFRAYEYDIKSTNQGEKND